MPINITSERNNEVIPHKMLIVGANEEITYYLAKIYLEEINQTFVFNFINKRPHIAFAYNVKNPPSNSIITFLRTNFINYFYYDNSKEITFKGLNGYKHVIIFDDIMEHFNSKGSDIIYQYQLFIKRFYDNQSLIHVVLPDLVFEPSDNIISPNITANSMFDYRKIAIYKFISHMIDYYRNAEKIAINQIYVPQLYQHESNNCINLNKKNIRLFYDSYNYHNFDDLRVIPRRGVLTYQELSKGLYLLYKASLKPNNYSISSDNIFSEYILAKYINNKINEFIEDNTMTKIIMDWSYLKELGFEPITLKEHLENFRVIREWLYLHPKDINKKMV